MANALASLGYSVHDFEEHLEYNLDNYLDFFEGRVGSEIFTAMYSSVDAVLDQPSCNLANILLQQFPDAKVSKDQEHTPQRSHSNSELNNFGGGNLEMYFV